MAEPEGIGVDRCWHRDGSSFKTPSLWPFSPLLFIDELQRELTLLLFGLEWWWLRNSWGRERILEWFFFFNFRLPHFSLLFFFFFFFFHCVLWGEGVGGRKVYFANVWNNGNVSNGHRDNLNIFLHKYMSLALFSYLIFGLVNVLDNFTGNWNFTVLNS